MCVRISETKSFRQIHLPVKILRYTVLIHLVSNHQIKFHVKFSGHTVCVH